MGAAMVLLPQWQPPSPPQQHLCPMEAMEDCPMEPVQSCPMEAMEAMEDCPMEAMEAMEDLPPLQHLCPMEAMEDCPMEAMEAMEDMPRLGLSSELPMGCASACISATQSHNFVTIVKLCART